MKPSIERDMRYVRRIRPGYTPSIKLVVSSYAALTTERTVDGLNVGSLCGRALAIDEGREAEQTR